MGRKDVDDDLLRPAMNSTNMARSKEVRLICWKRCQHTSHDAVEHVKDDAENEEDEAPDGKDGVGAEDGKEGGGERGGGI